MGRTTSLVAALALVAAGAAAALAAQTVVDRTDPQVLIQLERNWNDAFYRKDIAAIEQILADEFMVTYEDGSQGDKAKELAMTREFNQQVQSARQEQFRVNIYGDTAVVSFTLHLTGPRRGQTVQVDLRYVDVFVWRQNRWQCVSSQSTKVADP